MTKEQETKLIELLELFFSEFDFDVRNAIPRNRVASLLKKRLRERKRWRGAPRGKPNNKNLHEAREKAERMRECPF